MAFAHTDTTNEVETYSPEVKQLLKMLTYKRPAGSDSEEEFIDVFIRSLKDDVDAFVEDGFGNIFIRVGNTNQETLFTCHTDSVHRTSGRQLVAYDPFTQLIYKSTNQPDNECLGADDAAGVALLVGMINAGVNGWYAFFRYEERGGQGSDYAFSNNAEFLSTFKRAIAFDRWGGTSVITHQGYGRCCSDEFAAALAAELNTHTGTDSFCPDGTGIFTDTANFTSIIPECTNVSVFYDAEHTVNESLDLEGWLRLRSACFYIDWENLPTRRVPIDEEAIDWGYDTYRYTSKRSVKQTNPWDAGETVFELRGMRYGQMLDWVKGNKSDPDAIAEVLYEMLDQIMALEEENADLLSELSGNYNNDVPPHAYNDYMDDDDEFDARLDVGLR